MPPKAQPKTLSWTPDLPIQHTRWEIVAQEMFMGRTPKDARTAAGFDPNTVALKAFPADWKLIVESRVEWLRSQQRALAKASDKSNLVTDEWCVGELKKFWDKHKEDQPMASIAAMREIRQFKTTINKSEAGVRELTARVVELVHKTKSGYEWNPKEVQTINTTGSSTLDTDAAVEAELGYDPVAQALETGREAVEVELAQAAGGE
jgi:hypothetical protein